MQFRTKKSMYRIFILSLIIPCTLAISCATPEGMEKYPERVIDRPHTLPGKVIETTFTGTVYYEKQQNSMGEIAIVPPVLPMTSRYPISDNLTLNLFFIIPTSLTWQFLHNDLQTLSLTSGFTSFFINPTYGTSVSWQVRGDHTLRLTSWLAIGQNAETTFLFRSKTNDYTKMSDNHFSFLSAGYGAGILFQLGDSFALKLSNDLKYSYISPSFFIFPSGDWDLDGKIFTIQHATFIWNISRRWDLSFEILKNHAALPSFETYMWISFYW